MRDIRCQQIIYITYFLSQEMRNVPHGINAAVPDISESGFS